MRGVIIKFSQLSPGSLTIAGLNYQILCVTPIPWFKGTEKLLPITCAHTEAEGFQQKRAAPSDVDAAETVRFSWKVVEPQGQCEHDVRIS